MGDRVREIMGHSVDSVSRVHGDREGLAILVNRDRLGEEGVQQRVGIEGVQLGGRVAVNLDTREVTSVINISYKCISLCSRSRI